MHLAERYETSIRGASPRNIPGRVPGVAPLEPFSQVEVDLSLKRREIRKALKSGDEVSRVAAKPSLPKLIERLFLGTLDIHGFLVIEDLGRLAVDEDIREVLGAVLARITCLLEF